VAEGPPRPSAEHEEDCAMKRDAERKYSPDELDAMYETACRRLAELGLDRDEMELFLGEAGRNGSGTSEGMGWDENRGTIAAVTWPRAHIMEWLREASSPGITEADRRAADYQSCRSQSGRK
jgi:hypothetical protein